MLEKINAAIVYRCIFFGEQANYHFLCAAKICGRIWLIATTEKKC